MPFIIIFIVVPFTELAIFARVSEHIGISTTLILAFITAIIGGSLVKHQGMQAILSMRKAMDQGQMPVTEIFDGFCLVAAGALLITPGFLTDAIGFALLIPPLRAALRHAIGKHTSWAASANIHGSREAHPRRSHNPSDLEGEYERVEDENKEIRDDASR